MFPNIDNLQIKMIELHDGRVRSLRWDWDRNLVAEIDDAYVYALGRNSESIAYDIYNGLLELTCGGVYRLAAEGGAFSRHDRIYSAQFKTADSSVDLVSLIQGGGVDSVEMTFFPAGSILISCETVRCRLTSPLTLVGRWPGALDDPDVRPKWINQPRG